jgi:hypothetical protein
MMVIMISKWVGDMFNISLYDIHVELKCIPFVESSAPAHHSLLKVRRIACIIGASISYKPFVGMDFVKDGDCTCRRGTS